MTAQAKLQRLTEIRAEIARHVDRDIVRHPAVDQQLGQPVHQEEQHQQVDGDQKDQLRIGLGFHGRLTRACAQGCTQQAKGLKDTV